jgi:hypothetical protein
MTQLTDNELDAIAKAADAEINIDTWQGLHHCIRKAIAAHEAKQAAECVPVAVIGSTFQLLWCREDWPAGLSVGDKLYPRPQQDARDAELLDAAQWALNELEALARANDSDYAYPDETCINALRAAIAAKGGA